MNEREITRLLKNHPFTRKRFRGCFARDELSQLNVSSGDILILNLSKRTSPGSHWVLIHCSKRHPLYFDPIGNPPLHAEVYTFMLETFSKLYYNATQLQALTSKVCGNYVCYFATQLSAGRKLEEIRRKHFKISPMLNDKIILRLFKREFQ